MAIDSFLQERPIEYRVILRDGAFAAMRRRGWDGHFPGTCANQIAQVEQGKPIRWLEMSRYLKAGLGRRPVI